MKKNIYKGGTKFPDFKGRDKDYRYYRTRIKNGMKEGPNFAGKYSIIRIGCGAGCTFSFIANNQTGAVITSFPLGGENNYMLDLTYHLDSNILFSSYEAGDGDTGYIVYNLLKFDGKNFNLIDSKTAKRKNCNFSDPEIGFELCSNYE